MGLLGCGSGDTAPATASNECEVGDPPTACFDLGALCGKATAQCVAGTPNESGPCVCQEAALVKMGPATQAVTDIESATFGGAAFYWAEFHKIIDFPNGGFTTIGVRRENDGVGVLLDNINDRISAMRVDGDALYLQRVKGGPGAITIAGATLPNPTADVAFPATAARVTSDDMGLYRDGAKLAGPVDSFSETPDGVYIAAAGALSYIPFNAPQPQPFLSVRGTRFNHVWVSGTNVYAAGLATQFDGERDVEKFTLYYADLSIVSE
jgi:hypothetical protein